MTQPLHLRVFLSSPGDVASERAHALELISALQRKPLLRGVVTLEVVAWDDPMARTPLLIADSPQSAVTMYNATPSACDLTVVILWSRMGTPLGEHLRRPDGTVFASGTEWELEDARRAGKRALVYVRTDKPRLDIDDLELSQKQKQYLAVRRFVQQLRDEDGSLRGAVNEFASTSEFGALLEQHLEAEIRQRLDRSARSSVRPLPPSERFRIFVASAADELRATRMRIINELERQEGIEIFNEVPPPLDQQRHAQAVLRSLEHADLSVHLIGNHSGFAVEWDEPEWTYPMEQMHLGVSHAANQLVLHPNNFSRSAITNASYAGFVDALSQLEVPRSRLEFVQCSASQMVNAILTKRAQVLEHRRNRIPNAKAVTAFVDAHASDQAFASRLLDALPRQNVAPLSIPPSDADVGPTKLTSQFAEHLRRSQMFIVVYGTVARHWVDERLNEAVKMILGEQLPTKVGVVVAPPRKREDEVSFPFAVINNSSGFDGEAVRRLFRQVTV